MTITQAFKSDGCQKRLKSLDHRNRYTDAALNRCHSCLPWNLFHKHSRWLPLVQLRSWEAASLILISRHPLVSCSAPCVFEWCPNVRKRKLSLKWEIEAERKRRWRFRWEGFHAMSFLIAFPLLQIPMIFPDDMLEQSEWRRRRDEAILEERSVEERKCCYIRSNRRRNGNLSIIYSRAIRKL